MWVLKLIQVQNRPFSSLALFTPILKAAELYFTTYLISHSNQDRDYSNLGCDVWCTMVGRYQFSGHIRCHLLQRERVWREWRWIQLVPLQYYSVATIVCEITSQKETIFIPFNLTQYNSAHIFNMTCLLYIQFLELTWQITHLPETRRLLAIIKMKSSIILSFYIVHLHITIAFT